MLEQRRTHLAAKFDRLTSAARFQTLTSLDVKCVDRIVSRLVAVVAVERELGCLQRIQEWPSDEKDLGFGR